MATVPNGVETLPKISIVWVGRTNVTDRQTDDRRQTDGRRHIANVNLSSRSLKTASKPQKHYCIGYGQCIDWAAWVVLCNTIITYYLPHTITRVVRYTCMTGERSAAAGRRWQWLESGAEIRLRVWRRTRAAAETGHWDIEGSETHESVTLSMCARVSCFPSHRSVNRLVAFFSEQWCMSTRLWTLLFRQRLNLH